MIRGMLRLRRRGLVSRRKYALLAYNSIYSCRSFPRTRERTFPKFQSCRENVLGTRMLFLHDKNDFAEIYKNLARYRFENNFVNIKRMMWKIQAW